MGRTGRISAFACCTATILLTLGADSAPSHQTESSKGVSVTMHVTPEDEPIAGRSSKILVTKVRPNRGRFSWRSCKCYLRISDSTGRVLLNRRARRRQSFTFPRASAYEIVFSGRVKRGRSFKRFRVDFAIRAG
ncbi:MAG: hypothetical protein ACRDLQ_09980 [Solirubrobacterales bacterium]